MNIIKPSVADIKQNVTGFFSSLGLVPSIVLFLIIAAVIFFAAQSIGNWAGGYVAQREIDAAKAEAAKWKQQAEMEHETALQYKGAAAAYKQQGEAVQSQLTELFNVRPELQAKSAASGQRVEQIRKQAIRPIDGDIKQRVDSVVTDLDGLYPEPR